MPELGGMNKDYFWNRNRPKTDISGQRFGRWTVIDRHSGGGAKGSMWLCKCDCGNKSVVSLGNLRSGGSTSCGCYKIERTIETKKYNLVGRRFGRLTVKEESSEKKSGRVAWVCKCDCGKEKTIVSKTLINGATQSCGCLRNERMLIVCRKFKNKREQRHSPVSHSSVVFDKIPKCDNPSQINGVVHVFCKMCGKAFAPKRLEIERRILAYNGKIKGENNFYCSEECKLSCPIFHARSDCADPRLRKPKTTTKKARSCQTKSLKQSQCDETNGQSYCEKCGDLIDVELHHTILVSKNPKEATNPATHMLLCAGCHTSLHAECR